jgi:flagellar biosynthesis protein FlhF
MSIHRVNVSKKSSTAGKRMMPRAFRAKTMPAALAAVEKAFGNSALIVSVHPISGGPSWQLWRRSGVEVVAMPSAMDALNGDTSAPDFAEEEEPDTPDEEEGYLSGMPMDDVPNRKAGSAAESFSRPKSADGSAHDADSPLPPSLNRLQESLVSQGVDSAWLRQTLQTLRGNSSLQILGDESLSRELVRQELLRRLRSDGGACLIHRKVIVLIGTSGCGKTSACAKIASYAMKALGKRVHWISSDTTRAGAIAKAQAFTAPLGIPLHLTYRPEELPLLVHRVSETELSLVDTPGCNPYRKEEIGQLDELLAEIPDRHILWVAPATAKESDLQDMYAAFSHLGIGGVVITRLDETRSLGEIFNFLHHSQLPVAFLSHGPRIQGDLHSGETTLLVSFLMGEKPF